MKTIIRNFLSVIRRFKMATLLNILGLSVAFTAVIVIGMQVDYDLSFDTNQAEADQIYRINAEFNGQRVAVLARPLIEEFKDYSPHVEASAISNSLFSQMLNLVFEVERDGVQYYYEETLLDVTEDYFKVFHFDMLEGVIEKVREPQVALIPQSMAEKMFGMESPIGKRLKSEDHQVTIGGVYRDFPKNSSTPNHIYIRMNDEMDKDNWGSYNYQAYVRMAAGAPPAQEILDAYVAQIDSSRFEHLPNIHFEAIPLKDVHFSNVDFDTVEKASMQMVWVLLAIALVILLIAAINFTNYSIALTPLRIKSLNTQKVLGATEPELRGMLVAEAIITCLLAWGLAIFFVHLLGMTSLTQLIGADMAIGLHTSLLLIVGGIALLVGLFAGIYPAYYMTSFAPALVLKGSFGLSPKGRQLRNGLVGVQFVASLALISVVFFMYLQMNYMQSASLGFDKEQIIVTTLNKKLIESKSALTNELKNNSHIEGISFANDLLSGGDNFQTWGRNYHEQQIMFQYIAVDTAFLRVMGISLLEGRNLRSTDGTYGGHVIFNEKAKNDFGLSVGDKDNDDGGEVIGFVPDLTITSMRKSVQPMAFGIIPDAEGRYAYIRTQAGSNHAETMRFIRATLDRLSPGYPFNVRFFDEVINSAYHTENHVTQLITWFSLIAVLISMVGVFGLVVFESEYKRKEIGVRKVLGSTTGQILAMFNIRYVKILAICFVIAAPIAWFAVARWLESFAYRTPMYIWVFLLAFLLIAAITIATVTFQSWRVADANPVDSLKTE
ncbi:ABC transporter permease [Parabacteroides sp. PF5-6]|uniref:ABC transporter permease n=1 Tax=Parabacteroides sp. PF5-6 TaxID=1742403 RepID=UPI0024057729|nr:ABC transporter permease [Parabacteroides sp. PF5-6]